MTPIATMRPVWLIPIRPINDALPMRYGAQNAVACAAAGSDAAYRPLPELDPAPVSLQKQLVEATEAAFAAGETYGTDSPQFRNAALIVRALGRLSERLDTTGGVK